MPDTSLETFIKYRQREHEPLMGFKWVCTSLPYGLPVTYVESVQVSWVKLNIKDGLFAEGTYSYFPGFSDIDQFTMTFHEGIGTKTRRWLSYWLSRIKNFETGTYFLPNNYKEDIKVSLLDNQNNKVMDVTMVDCWPIVPDPIELNYTDPSSRVTLSVSFSVDDQKIDHYNPSFLGGKASSGGLGIAGLAGSLLGGGSSSNNGFGSELGIVSSDSDSFLASTFGGAPLQNPKSPVDGMFEALGNAAPSADTPEEPGFFTKLWNATTGAIQEYGGEYMDTLTQALKDGDPRSLEDVENIVNNHNENQQDGLVAKTTGSASRVLFDELVRTPASERDAKQEENSSFLAELGSSLRRNSEQYADAVITDAENANPSNPPEFESFAVYTAENNDTWLDNVTDDTTDSLENYYDKYKNSSEQNA